MKDELRQSMIKTSAAHWWFAARRRILDGVVASLTLPAEARIFEAGCGDGQNLPWLAKHGKVSAIEMADDLREAASARGVAEVYAGHLPDGLPAQLLVKPFDAIVMFDVLEHIEADIDSLKTLKTCLKPGGCIVIAVPAFPWLWSAHDEAHHHKRRYTKATLINALMAAGFTIHYISYYNFLLFPLAVAGRLAEKWFGTKESLGADIPPAPINALCREVFALERFLVPHIRLPFGVSLIAVAKL